MQRSAALNHESTSKQQIARHFWLYRSERWLLAIFILSLPFVNPWVHGDGVGYYAYARSLLIEHRLDFAPDWKHANESFISGREDANGRILADQYSATGHLKNLWSVGPSILWLPFLAVTHAGVIIADHFGAHVAADGFSAPYRYTMALATCLYGFLGLWLSFCLARKYFDEKWAFLATIGIWGASSLAVYMYFNPSWSHAHSAFAVALFLWHWHRTQRGRSIGQWILLGLISGLMVDVYYPNGVLLLVPLIEAAMRYAEDFRSRSDWFAHVARRLGMHVLYVAAFAVAILPTLISRRVIFGSPLQTGYYSAHSWLWASPALLRVLLSADHGLLVWTPILIAACAGLVLFLKVDRAFAAKLIACTVAFYLLIAFYPSWDGLSSFGNRFFVSLTSIFIIGLAAFFDWLATLLDRRPAGFDRAAGFDRPAAPFGGPAAPRERRAGWNPRRTFAIAAASTALLILWNFGMMYQWGMHLVPVRGPISWREAVHNQFAVVPSHVARDVERYFLRRGTLMQHIEKIDMRQLKARSR
ncbi:MAG TPA: glycosyltransferase family 39 protein [Candidatus Acidoferrum sp.]|nr:glycosyltransferase family 39 protein [Candidatus Acidoferrum sp.]